MNNILLPEDILREAVIKACEEENAAYCQLAASENKRLFPDKHTQRASRNAIKKLYQKEKDTRKDNTEKPDVIEYPLKTPGKSLRIKIALIAIIIMMFGSITVMAVEPLREKMYKMVETLFPTHTNVSFEEISEETEKNESDSQTQNFNPADFPKKLKWVPEGFELIQEDVDSDLFYVMQTYVNTENQYLAFDQMMLENTNELDITSNGTSAKDVSINGETGYLFTDETNYHIILYTKNGFAYKIGGYLEETDLIKCLEETLK